MLARPAAVLLALASAAAGVLPLAAQVPAARPSENLLRATADLPVFALVNSGGNLLISTPRGGKPVVGLFMRRGLAESFVGSVRSLEPQVASQLRVESPKLADLLRSRPAGNPYDFDFIPDPGEVTAAQDELRAQGRPTAGDGVPVFLLHAPGSGYVTISVNGRTVIPAFLGHAEVLALRAQAQASLGTPNLLVIEVTTLENLVQALQTGTEPFYTSLLLRPSGMAASEATP